MLTLFSASEADTMNIAEHFTRTLYPTATLITLRGDLGAGKTLFSKALMQSLGIADMRGSPTFSLAEEYVFTENSKQKSLVHVDFYRLSNEEAAKFWHELDSDADIKLLEWPERVPSLDSKAIHITISGNESKRKITIDYNDEPVLSTVEIQALALEVHLPTNIQMHCRLVAAIAHYFGTLLLQKNIPVRLEQLYSACLLHDMYRFVDFTPEHAPEGSTLTSANQDEVWLNIKRKFAGKTHGRAIASMLRTRNQNILAEIIEPHELWELPHTIEQKLLYYADKRSIGSSFHTLDERMNDLCTRYSALAAKHDVPKLQNELAVFEQWLDQNASLVTSEMVVAHAKQHRLLLWDSFE